MVCVGVCVGVCMHIKKISITLVSESVQQKLRGHRNKCSSVSRSPSLSRSRSRSLSLALSLSISLSLSQQKPCGQRSTGFYKIIIVCVCIKEIHVHIYIREWEGGRERERKKRWGKKKEGTPIRSNNGEKASYPHRGSAE